MARISLRPAAIRKRESAISWRLHQSATWMMCWYVPPRSEAGRKPPVRKPITLVPPSHGVALWPRKGSAQAGSDSVRGAKRDGKGGGSYRTVVAGPDAAVVGRDDQQRVLPAPRRAQRRREVAADGSNGNGLRQTSVVADRCCTHMPVSTARSMSAKTGSQNFGWSAAGMRSHAGEST